MPRIETLVKDIEDVLEKPHEWSKEAAERLGHDIAKVILDKLSVPQEFRIRMSNLGEKCRRRLWYQKNTPEDGEVLPASARLKFLFGDVIEQLVLFLAKEAGHKVDGTQDQVFLGNVKGHRDAVIDGVVVDAKSASTQGMVKFRNHIDEGSDDFGYLPQLAGYLSASQDDPLVTEKDLGAFLAVDKTLGHIVLDVHHKKGLPSRDALEKRIQENLALIEGEKPPEREFSPKELGKSGNMELATKCSYCEFKRKCWPGLRSFAYSNGVKHLTTVVREPDVKEIFYNA